MKAMISRISACCIASLLLLSCQKEQPVGNSSPANDSEPQGDELINVTFNAQDEDSKVGLYNGFDRLWQNGDKLGIFTGDNVNSCFTLSSGALSATGTFSGCLSAVSSEPLYAYYPYVAGITDPTSIPVDYSNQVYDGNFEDSFPSFGKYAIMRAEIANFSLDNSGMTSASCLYFTHYTGLACFKISSSLDQNLEIDNISINASHNNAPDYVFSKITTLDATTGSYRYAPSYTLSVAIPREAPLVLEPSQTKNVMMVVCRSNFDDTDLEIEVRGKLNGQNVKMIVTKSGLTEANNFVAGKRRNISLDLTSSLPIETSHRIDVKTLAVSSFTVPTILQTYYYLPGEICWGDGSYDEYSGFLSHTYSTTETHELSFDCWGDDIDLVKFDTIEGLSEVDFTNF